MAPTLGAIVVAAGLSTRMEGIDKAFTPLLGMPLIAHCLDQLETFAKSMGFALHGAALWRGAWSCRWWA